MSGVKSKNRAVVEKGPSAGPDPIYWPPLLHTEAPEIKMKATIYLRIASVLTLIHAILHTLGGVFGKIDPGPATVAVAAMKSNQFLLMGNTRSFWDFYRGMGLSVSILLSSETIVFWLLANLARRDAARLRPILWTFLFAYLVLSLNSYTYFFAGPVITEVLIAACLGAAIVTSRSDSEVQIQAG